MPRERFIAGAVCPSCGAEDKTFVRTEADVTVRGCRACGFEQSLDEVVDQDPQIQTVKLPE